MLVLSRKLEEEIVIDGEIVIKVIEIRGDRVRLGVTAPVSVGILRRELTAERSSSGDAAQGALTSPRATGNR